MKPILSLPTLLLCALTGCGTVSNLQKDCVPFGGVAVSFEEGKTCLNQAGSGACIPPIFDYMWATYEFLIDVPLSAIGDTVTLPFTILARHGGAN